MLEIVTEIDAEQTRLFHYTLFYCVDRLMTEIVIDVSDRSMLVLKNSD